MNLWLTGKSRQHSVPALRRLCRHGERFCRNGRLDYGPAFVWAAAKNPARMRGCENSAATYQNGAESDH